jgi:hypothetical protein
MFKNKKYSLGTPADMGLKRPNWVKRHKKLVIILSIVFAVLIGGGIAAAIYFLNQKPAPTPQAIVEETPPPPPPPKYYSPLTGNEVKSEAVTKQAVTGIMIENSPDARPQSGLKDSGVVFEAIAEGGITRFLVLYQEQKPQLIGPVRSVRMYYVDWVAAFNASVAHIGGSSQALKEVRNGKYRDIDQFFNAGSYWRATDRYAPHNVYTSFKLLDALNKAKGYTTSDFTGFTRRDRDENPTRTSATSIDVTISSDLYNSHYEYDAKKGYYNRYQAGAPHTDRETGHIHPYVVIVMKIPEKLVFEDGYRQQLTTIGKGTAYIFQEGTVQKVTWSKEARTEQIKFTDEKGKDVPLVRGQTWLTAVPADTGGAAWE